MRSCPPNRKRPFDPRPGIGEGDSVSRSTVSSWAGHTPVGREDIAGLCRSFCVMGFALFFFHAGSLFSFFSRVLLAVFGPLCDGKHRCGSLELGAQASSCLPRLRTFWNRSWRTRVARRSWTATAPLRWRVRVSRAVCAHACARGSFRVGSGFACTSVCARLRGENVNGIRQPQSPPYSFSIYGQGYETTLLLESVGPHCCPLAPFR